MFWQFALSDRFDRSLFFFLLDKLLCLFSVAPNEAELPVQISVHPAERLLFFLHAAWAGVASVTMSDAAFFSQAKVFESGVANLMGHNPNTEPFLTKMDLADAPGEPRFAFAFWREKNNERRAMITKDALAVRAIGLAKRLDCSMHKDFEINEVMIGVEFE